MSAANDVRALETWRILLVRRSGDEILLGYEATKFTLPQVGIPIHERIAANINRAVERQLRLNVISLYEIVYQDQEPSNGVFYHALALAQPSQATPKDTSWTAMRSLVRDSFARKEDFLAIDAFRMGLEAGKKDHFTEPFLKPSWFAEVASWVRDSLRPHSLNLTGTFEQLNASATFSLIRFETDQAPVWFKAVGEPNVREYGITLALARLCPAFLPRVLASEPRWNAWLTAHTFGVSLASHAEMRFWECTAASLAKLQIASIGDSRMLRQAGARDLRVSTLLRMLEPFFKFIADCAGPSPVRSPKELTLSEISEVRDGVRLALRDLDNVGVMETVGHMDLNPGNIFCMPDRSLFLDWAETYVGCPLFSFEYLRQHSLRAFSSDSLLDERLRNSYLQPWRKILPAKELVGALACSPLAALFGYAATLWSSATMDISRDCSQTRYLMMLVRKMKREVWQRELEKVSL